MSDLFRVELKGDDGELFASIQFLFGIRNTIVSSVLTRGLQEEFWHCLRRWIKELPEEELLKLGLVRK